ncbi:site-specific integrase [Paraburkholderia sp. 40]|uniref:site-specific integrase n=1 Tax=unclassified Paraburkholderia TaxID=2615204 RepID=UPI003D232344
MTSLPANASRLRQRMIDDMRMRQLAPKTQDIYLHIVREFARFLGRSPDTATVEDLRRYQLYLVEHGTSAMSLNHAITGLKFFFTVTLDRPELMVRMQPVRVPRVLPVVLSPEEVRRLIAAAGNLKHQTALSVAYGAGLRASEVVALKVSDIDSQRMTLRIEQGKGRKDRYAMLSPVLLERLRLWWRVARAQGTMLDGGWLFPGMEPVDPLSTRQLNRAVHAAAEAAQIGKRVSPPALRHYVSFRIMSGKETGLLRSPPTRAASRKAALYITRHSLSILHNWLRDFDGHGVCLQAAPGLDFRSE